MIAVLFSAAGVAVLLVGLGTYAATIPRGEVPRVPLGVGLALVASTGLAIAGWSSAGRGGGPLWLVIPLSLIPLLSAPLLVWIHAQRKVPLGTLRVRVGEPLPPFRALTSESEVFDSETLSGQRVLLKFFRGEWCPFCQAELKRFDAMEAQLAQHGVRVIALSKDAPEAARRHRARDQLRLTLLCDPELRVIRQYGLEHRKALEISRGRRVSFFGLTVGTRASFRHMAIPTTLLIDERGIIRGIDQTDDYRLRSSTARVFAAVEHAFGNGPPPDAQAEPLAHGTSLNSDPACEGC